MDTAPDERHRLLWINDPDYVEAALTTFWLTRPRLLFGQEIGPLAEMPWGLPEQEGISNPYWKLVRQLPGERPEFFQGPSVVGWGMPVTLQQLVYTFAWAIPSPADIAFLVKALAGRPVLEMGAGTGYWAWQLSQREVDVLAFDDFSWANAYRTPITQYHPVHEGSVEQIPLHPNRILMLCWPPYEDPLAYEALRAYQGELLIYIGENEGGCCGDDAFFDALNQSWKQVERSERHINYTGIRSQVWIYQRREVPLTIEEMNNRW